ncbi:MAG: GNAT family N-acetyltransferase [Planctomycetes bacterium]|nr:GNAT family N-acetyltransferase [Planctomycetota bacterium]
MPNLDVTVRDARAGDREFIADCNRAMARETEGKELAATVLRAGVEAALADRARGWYLIAERAKKPAGCLFVTCEWSDWRNAVFWWIQSVYVLPEARGLGVYGALHREVLRRARESGGVCGVRLYVDRANAHARRVYEALGMRVSQYDLMEQEIPPR